tara:strand:+ start:296 stop:547 length:252 start_codon:yes stop_codon:yes gene_type:complete
MANKPNTKAEQAKIERDAAKAFKSILKEHLINNKHFQKRMDSLTPEQRKVYVNAVFEYMWTDYLNNFKELSKRPKTKRMKARM